MKIKPTIQRLTSLFPLFILLLFAAVFLVSGCGGSGSSSDASETADGTYDSGDGDDGDTTGDGEGGTTGSGFFIVSSIGGTTSEAGNAATFTVSLASEPSSDVDISLFSNDETEGWVDPTELTFTSTNWSTSQTVLVRGVDDYIDDGDVSYTIILNPAVSADTSFDGEDPADVAVVNIDNDAIGVEKGNVSGQTTEWGKQATFTIKLASAPTEDVTIPITSSDETEGTVEPDSVTFTTENWNSIRTITITGEDDGEDDGHVQYSILLGPASSNDEDYDGLTPSPVHLTNYDDDVFGFSVSSSDNKTWEWGETGTISVKLLSYPQASVTIDISSSDETEGTVSPDSLTFDGSNWDLPQIITVTGVNDDLQDGAVSYDVILSPASSADSNYDTLDPDDVAMTNTDDDTAGYTLTIGSGNTSEGGGSKNFSLALTSPPTDDVNIPVNCNDETEGTIEISSLTFDFSNWWEEQTVTVTGEDDSLRDGDVSFAIILGAASSTDASYDGLDPSDVPITNIDNDIVGFIRSHVSGEPSEGGGTATFTLKLKSAPFGNVSFPVSSDDETEGTVDPESVTFTTSNWDTAQTVTVTGEDDATQDGNVSFTIVIGPSECNFDASYDGLDPDDIVLTNIDNDTVGISVSSISGNTSETGGSASFTIALDAPPTGNVTINIGSSDTSEGIVAPETIVFTPSNWNIAQQVLVVGQDDTAPDDNVDYTIILYAAISEDLRYHNLDPADISITNIDNDVPGFTSTPFSITVAEGTETTFTLKINTQPNANVTVDLGSSDPTEASVSPSSLTFTPGNWITPQSVTVTGEEDDVIDGTQHFKITLSNVTSSDSDYSGMDPADLNISSEDSYNSTYLVLNFPFSGNTEDQSGNDNDGTPSQVTLTSDRFEASSSAYYFDGTGHISTNLDVQPGAMSQTTWMAWIKPTQTSSTDQAILCSDDGLWQRCLSMAADNTTLRVSWGGGSWSPIKLDLNLWQHIAVVYSSTDVLIYKNGAEYSRGGAEIARTSNHTFQIGVNPYTGSNNFNGKIDDVRVYNTALTPTEIRTLYGYYTINNLEGDFFFSGNVNNSSGNGSQAYNYGANLTEDRTGASDKAYTFDGVDDYIYTNIDVQPSVMSETSWAAWIRPTQTSSGDQAVLCTSFGLWQRCLKMVANTTTAGVYVGDRVWRPIGLTLGIWQHLAVVYDSDNVYFYKNGVLYSLEDTEVIRTNLNPLHIGMDPYNDSSFFNGDIDDVKVYNRALSAAEVQNLFGYSINNNLAASFDFSGNVNDNSGSGARAYNNNATLISDRSGNAESAYLLDGTTSYIKTSVDVQPQSMAETSWSIWIKPTSADSNDKTVLCTQEGLWQRCLKMTNSTTAAAIFVGNTTWRPIKLDLNLWQHLVLVYKSDNVLFYKNGVEYSRGTPEFLRATLNPLAIGIDPYSDSAFFEGAVDDVKIYNKALTAQEVTSLYGYSRTNNLAASFSFTGDLSDSSGSGAQAYNYGATLVEDRNGVAESAYQLDGSSDYIYTNLDVQPSAMTETSWSAWIKPVSLKSNDQYILCTNNGLWERCLKMNTNTTNAGIFKGNGTWVPFGLDLNLWQHIVVIYQSDNILFYKNGVAYGLGSAEAISPTLNTLHIGRNPDGNNSFFTGAIDDVKIYDKALSAAEVRSLYGYSVSNNLMAHFPFSGNMNDSSGSGAQALNFGADPTTDQEDTANEAYAFNGTSDYIYTNIDAQPSAMPETTWMAWIYPQSTGDVQDIFCIEDGLWERCLRFLANNNVSVFHGSGSWAPGVAVTMDTWQHVAVVYKSGNILFYMDGTEYSRASGETIQQSLKTLVIGRDPESQNSYFKGKMDEIRIYDKALTQTEIQTLMSN
ncbi:LamG domain-containing protein [bacterium]|nr:LamG domain-containing protein [bacterium]